jgi:hypothetical protein
MGIWLLESCEKASGRKGTSEWAKWLDSTRHENGYWRVIASTPVAA